jgi:uncharacterized membrane protein
VDIVNPFNLKSALLARHAQHVVLIHFPIALFLTSVLFDLAAQWKKSRVLAVVAYYNLLASAISCVPVLATGILAWRWQLDGQRLKGILLEHIVLAGISCTLIWLIACMQLRNRRKPRRNRSRWRLPVEIVAAIAIGLTAHLGGFLSGVNGPG